MPPGKDTPKNYQQAEDLLSQGYAVSGVRDRDAVADWLRLVYRETGRPSQARDFAAQAAADRAPPPPSPGPGPAVSPRSPPGGAFSRGPLRWPARGGGVPPPLGPVPPCQEFPAEATRQPGPATARLESTP